MVASRVDLHRSLRDYWLDRVVQHLEDSYAGVTISKFPEDLRAYEHILWRSRPNAVVEVGTQFGGSALWFRDRLRALRDYRLIDDLVVVSIDLDVSRAHENIARVDPAYETEITLIQADIRAPGLRHAVEEALPAGARCLVVEDSAHTFDTTSAALKQLSPLVPKDGFFIVEDGCVDVEEMRAAPDWPRGVLPAIQDFLSTEQGGSFVVRRDMELYGISCHPGGFLQRSR
jgi:cephalosporin hydroxylase